MRTFKVVFSKPKSKFPIFSWLIRLYEETEFSHVGIWWQTKRGKTLFYHSAGLSVNFLGEQAYKNHIIEVESYEFNVEDNTFDEFVDFCIDKAGTPYALLEVFGVPLVDLFNLKKNPFASGPAKQYCAELVARALGVLEKREIDIDADRVTLKQLRTYVDNKFWEAQNANVI